MHHERLDRAAIGALNEVAQQLPLRALLRIPGPVDLRSDRLVARHEALLGHDLQHLQDRGVASWLRFVEDGLDFAHRPWSGVPQDPQNGEFKLGRTDGCARHGRKYRRNYSSLSTKLFVI